MVELIDVVLHAPHTACFANPIGSDFGRDDFIGAPPALGDHSAVEIAKHALAHGVKTAVAAAHANTRGHGQVLKGVGLVGDGPGMANRCGVSCRADDDLCPLVGGLARHLWEHAVVANDEAESRTLGSGAHGHTDIARLPWLHRYPGMEFPVVQANLPQIIDDESTVVGVAVGVGLHDGEASPNLIANTRGLEGRDLGAINAHHQFRRRAHAQPVQAVLWKHDQVHAREVSSGLVDHVTNDLGLRFELRWGIHHRQLQLHQAHHHPIGGRVQTTESTHRLLLI